MSRLLVLTPLFLWLALPASREGQGRGEALAWLIGGLGLILAIALLAADHTAAREKGKRMPLRFARRLRRLAVPAINLWFAACIVWLDWRDAVGEAVAGLGFPPGTPPLTAIELTIAVGPIYLAWAIALACEWPVVRWRWMRQDQFEEMRHGRTEPGPRFWRWWMHTFRGALAYALAPLLAFAIARDIAALVVWQGGWQPSPTVSEAISIGVGIGVMITLAPWILAHTLPTVPLPAGPVRERLGDFARACGGRGVRLRLWNTGGQTANALAIGFLPGMRFVLLSDLLLQALEPQQVEAVLAHEIGHVRHRHMAWLLLFFASIVAVVAGPATLVAARLPESIVTSNWLVTAADLAVVASMLLSFGYVMRRFERQADLFSGRMMQRHRVLANDAVDLGPGGAAAFSNALERAARSNGVPIVPPRRERNLRGLIDAIGDAGAMFLHGTVESRRHHLARLIDPAAAARFDRRMLLFRGGVLIVLAASLGVLWWVR